MCLQHPDFGVVSLGNADELMLRLDEPKEAPFGDLDRCLSRIAGVSHFVLV